MWVGIRERKMAIIVERAIVQEEAGFPVIAVYQVPAIQLSYPLGTDLRLGAQHCTGILQGLTGPQGW